MQVLSLVFKLPTRPVLMATDGPGSSTCSFRYWLMYAALLNIILYFMILQTLRNICTSLNQTMSQIEAISHQAPDKSILQTSSCLDVVLKRGPLSHLSRRQSL